MSRQIFLRSAVITGFRGLPDDFVVKFRTEPGVTILVGPNGSGKSRAIDAIEWALTGGSARLPNLTAAQIKTTRDPFKTLNSDRTPLVELEFTDADQVIRYRSDEGPEKAATLLKRSEENWQRLKSVSRALQQTHFSSQRAAMRLAYEEDSASLLEAFTAPGGFERLKVLGNRLWGTDTRTAFRTLQRETEAQTAIHRRSLESVERILKVRADTSVTAAEIVMRLDDLLSELPKDVPAIDTKAGLDAVERELLGRQRAAESAWSMMRETTTEQRAASSVKLFAEAEMAAAQETAATADRLLASRQASAAAVLAEEVEATAEYDRLSTELGKAEHRTAMIARQDELLRTLEVTDVSLRDLRGRHTRALARVSNLSTLDGLARRHRAGRLLEALKQAEANLLQPRHPVQAVEDLTKQIEDLQQARTLRMQARDKANEALTNEQERLKAIAGYASALAEQLEPHDTTCPVCAATYEKGVLASLAAEQAQKAMRFEVADRARRLNEATQELGRVEGSLKLAQSQLLEAERNLAQLRENLVDQARQQTVFGEDWTIEKAAAVSQQFLDLASQLNFEPNEAIRDALSRAMEEADQLKVAIARHYDDQTAASAELDKVVPVLREVALAKKPLESLLQLRGELAQADIRLRAARETHSHASRLATDAATAAEQARNDLLAKKSAAITAAARLEELAARVRELSGGVAEVEFLARQRELASVYDQTLVGIANLRAEERRVSNDSTVFEQELAILGDRYSHHAVNDLVALRSLIVSRLEESERAEKSVDLLGKRLSHKAREVLRRDRDVRRTELGPWNTLFNLIYKNLAGSSRERLELTTDAKVDMRRPGAIDAHRIPHVDDVALEGWMPVHYFSEGQVAALQISNVVTASILYDWSRWRALLFDDPLQHADVIKVNAFSDLIRGMCLDMGHQIVVTTHDAQQADFIAAKFEAVGLAASQVPFERRIVGRTEAE